MNWKYSEYIKSIPKTVIVILPILTVFSILYDKIVKTYYLFLSYLSTFKMYKFFLVRIWFYVNKIILVSRIAQKCYIIFTVRFT